MLNVLRILYVEDHPETREALQSLLQPLVAELYLATDGEEGLALYKRDRPDIVVTDIQMPNMDGLTMSAEIKKLNPEQVIVVLSAYNDVDYLFKAIELGIQHYIGKPVGNERLLVKLGEIAERMNLEKAARRYRKLLEQYKLLVDEKAIVCKIDRTGTISYTNKRFLALSGYDQGEVIGRPFYTVCGGKALFREIMASLSTSADEADNIDPTASAEAMTATSRWTGIINGTDKQGRRYVVDTSILAVVDEQEEIAEYVALMVDITAMYQRYERLALDFKNDLEIRTRLLAQYEKALDIGTSLCVVDPEGRIVSANRNFCHGLNCVPEALEGHQFADLVQDCTNFREKFLIKAFEQDFTSGVVKIRYRDEVEKVFSMIIVVIRGMNGRPHSFLSLSQDITDSVRLDEEIMDTQKELLYVMGEVVENRSHETGKHVKRVAELSEFIALKYGLSKQHAEMIKIASPMHDVGKVGISDDILHKNGKLSEEEFEIMKTHAVLGYNLLKHLDKPLLKMAANIAHEHHERYDGNGYPNGLCANEISIEGRIVSLVDVFDALSSERAYKKPWKHEDIIDYITLQRGTQFDPDLVDILLDNIDRVIAIRDMFRD
ncbi:MAG: HD domain-containing phosphohydrolase [Gammaproteobacteria bacterium]